MATSTTLSQHLAMIMLIAMAMQTTHGWLLKLPKLEEKELKKLDFLNLFAEKKEEKLHDFEKIKELFEEKKLKELEILDALKVKKLDAFGEFKDLLLAKKEKKFEFIEDKVEKKVHKMEDKFERKIHKPIHRYRPRDRDCYHEKPRSYESDCEEKYDDNKYYDKDVEEEEEEYEYETVTKKSTYDRPCDCKSHYRHGCVPTAYDVRDEHNARYFT